MGKIGFEEDAAKIGDRAENIARYWAVMQPQFDAELEAARGDLVRRFRANPRGWPEIDTKYDRWYREADWADDGRYVGERPCIKALNPDASAVAAPMINSPEEKAAKLAAAKAALAEVEGRVGVTTVTKSPTEPRVTETSPSPPGGEKDHPGVTESRTGRPKKDNALSPAEKQKAYRERVAAEKAKGETK